MINKMKQSVKMLAGILSACVRPSVLKMAVMVGMLLGCVQFAHAGQGLSLSSTTSSPGTTPVFRVAANESVQYILESTASYNNGLLGGTTINFEMSTNASNWSVVITTNNANGGFSSSGTIISGFVAPGPVATFYRWNILQSSSGFVCMTIRDVDDQSAQTLKNNKSNDLVQFNDDSVGILGMLKADRLRLPNTLGTSQGTNLGVASSTMAVIISTGTQLVWAFNATPGLLQSQYPFGALPGSTMTAIIDHTFTILQSTGAATNATSNGGITLGATPTISTATAVNGDTIVFECITSSITFQDNNTLTGSGLHLGATTRACGTNDMLGLIFFNGFWRELFFANNLEP